MRTIRRIYLYLVAAISLEVVLWGVINLLRAMLDSTRVGGSAAQLAGALATIIVGLPVFFLHWWLVQRRIGTDAEERFAGVRAIFLYGLLFGLLIPTAQNTLAILNRAVIALFDLNRTTALLGVDQTWVDNAIALAMNALLAAYFMSVLRRDWQAAARPPEEAPGAAQENLSVVRRVFRYALVVYTLSVLVYGVQQILTYLFDQFGPPNVNALAPLANGLSLSIFGVILWTNAWRTVQQAMERPEEQRSILRLVFLYAAVFIGVATVLATIGDVFYELLRILLGEPTRWADWASRVSGSVAVAIPLAGVWAYHAAALRDDLDSIPSSPRREGLSRLYRYVLAFAGLITTFIGAQTIGAVLIDQLVIIDVIDTAARNSLAGGLAALAVGLPLWLRQWLRVREQAAREGEEGDRARRSVIRKAYLYLVVFIGVVGVMISAGGLIFQLLSIVLGERQAGAAREILQLIKILVLFAALLGYHWQALQQDNRLAGKSLAEKHSLFPVLVLDPGDETFADAVVAAIRAEAQEIPVAVHFTGAGPPGETLSSAGAVVLPSPLAANPPEALRIWLHAFEGTRLVVPTPHPGWMWIDVETGSLEKLGKQVAAAVRKLAEGEELETGGRVSGWVIALGVLGGLIALTTLINLLSYLLFSF